MPDWKTCSPQMPATRRHCRAPCDTAGLLSRRSPSGRTVTQSRVAAVELFVWPSSFGEDDAAERT